MTPDERQLLAGLFDRMNTASKAPRDREADAFINDRVRAQPYAPYLLAQTVIVQEQALRAAADRIQELEAQTQNGGQPQEETSFLGSIGKSLFGGAGQNQQRPSVPPSGGGTWGRGPAAPQPNYPPQQQGGPWGQQGGGGGWGQQGGGGFQAPQGGGFLKGALGAAAGVAGGVLAADALRGLFGSHNNPFGMASGMPGETVVNNYYDSDGNASGGTDMAAADAQQDFLQDQGDDFADNSFDSGDDSSNV